MVVIGKVTAIGPIEEVKNYIVKIELNDNK